MNYTVGIGEYRVSSSPEDYLKTYALASCVGITFYCPRKKIAGMLHAALPYPLDEEEGITRPGYYVSTGIPLLINLMCSQFGCVIDELQINLYGGANSIRKIDYFNIGQRNIKAVREILSARGVMFYYSEVGGTISRTLEMEVATGVVKVFTQPITI
jgi:chemotaxis protein CheD